ncbi:glutathione-disulfide reductase [Novosphingopyxis sp.]|uniref:glutathione-disulfide reductase n=1 Tax=Novosphingopyxis sp. TaxID=2709690 RepID=UPI003B58DFD9
MPKFDFDFFVIGAGSGGVRASRIAAGHGARVGIAEEFRVGGTCVIRGCVPKKLLVIGAHFAEDMIDAKRFGWTADNASFDWGVLRDHVLTEVDRLEAAYRTTLTNHRVVLHEGRAVMADRHTIEIDGKAVTADKVLIATGSAPQMINCPGAELAITSNEVFHLNRLPKRIVIAGGGYIANEFAGIFNELGVKVTIVNRSDKLLRGYDRSVVDRLEHISTAKGITFRYNAPFESVKRSQDGELRITFQNGDALETDLLLAAIGRLPASSELGIEALGVKTKERGGIRVDKNNQTAIDNIYAVGDVTDRIQLTPVAIREGHAVADSLFGKEAWVPNHDMVASAVFSHPPIASIGMTESQARIALGDVEVYTSDFRAMKNVMADRNERSLYKLVVDPVSRKVVGAHLIGPDAPEIMQGLAIALTAGLTKEQIDRTVAIHPTMAEELVLMR